MSGASGAAIFYASGDIIKVQVLYVPINCKNNKYIYIHILQLEYSSVYLFLLNCLDTIDDHDINLLLLTYVSTYTI